jgi:hypothetical protein
MSLLKEDIHANGKLFEIDLPKDTKLDSVNISDSLYQQPGLVAYYGEFKAQALYERNRVADQLETARVLARDKVRRKNDEGKRLTKEQLSDMVEMLPEIVAMRLELMEAELTLEKATVCVNSIKERGTSMTNITTLVRYERGAVDVIMEEGARSKRRNY